MKSQAVGSPKPLGGAELRRTRIRSGFELRDVARELGVRPGELRALEWDRRDLLRSPGYAERLTRRYLDWLEPDGVPRPVRVASG